MNLGVLLVLWGVQVLEETGVHIRGAHFATAVNTIWPETGKHYVTLFMLASADKVGRTGQWVWCGCVRAFNCQCCTLGTGCTRAQLSHGVLLMRQPCPAACLRACSKHC